MNNTAAKIEAEYIAEMMKARQGMTYPVESSYNVQAICTCGHREADHYSHNGHCDCCDCKGLS